MRNTTGLPRPSRLVSVETSFRRSPSALVATFDEIEPFLLLVCTWRGGPPRAILRFCIMNKAPVVPQVRTLKSRWLLARAALGLTGAVSACFDEVNGHRFFVCDRPMGTNGRTVSTFSNERRSISCMVGGHLARASGRHSRRVHRCLLVLALVAATPSL
jgi:hypothetical protein